MPRLSYYSSGSISWGAGGGPDATLYRAGASIVRDLGRMMLFPSCANPKEMWEGYGS